MDELLVTCECGEAFTRPRAALGQESACPKCGESFAVTDANSRELTQAEMDVRLFLDDDAPPPPPPQASSVARQAPAPAPSARKAIPGVTAPMQGEALRDERGIAKPHPLSRGMAPQSAPEKTPQQAGIVSPPKAEQHAKAPLARCERCDRPFRGPWDRLECDGETLCHICANKIDNFVWGAAPVRPPTGEHGEIMKQIAKQYTWTEPPRPEPDPEDPARRRRHMLILAGIAVITITVALLLPEGGMFSMNPGGTPRELSESFNYVIIAIDALLGIVMYAIAIYSTLSMAQHLPNETFLANILAVLIVSAIIVAINRLPFAGFIIGIIVLLRFYELSISQLFMFFIFLVPAYVCTQVLRVFIFGFLAMLLT